MRLKDLQGLLDQVTQNAALSLRVLNFVTDADTTLLKEIQHWQNLPVVRDHCSAHSIWTSYQHLQDFQSNLNNLRVTSVQGS